jgi:YHS domain-containing protein
MKYALMTLALALGLVGCGGGSSNASTTEGQTTETSGDQTASATVVPNTQAQIGDTTTCPISGETFVVSESSPSAEYNGATYHFCCPGCRERFLANPEQYLNAQPAAPAEGEAAPAT